VSSAEITFTPDRECAESLRRSTLPRAKVFWEQGAPRRGTGWLRAYLALTLLGAAGLVGAVATGLQAWTPAAWVALVLVAMAGVWIAGGAVTALLGMLQAEPEQPAIPGDWRPTRRTAILVLLCGEPAGPLASALATLHRRTRAAGLSDSTAIFVLSDTSDPCRVDAEESALAGLVAAGAINYRRRAANTRHKPGNIADWLATHGDGFGYMLVLDTDSRMTAERIRALIYRMEREPQLGLLQAGMSMVPGRSRFGRHQRLSGRLLFPNFGRGLAAWSGDAGNYWGHNAIMRVAAFRCAAALPVLSGPAPFGGPPLSHDFVEAAWIRREGWNVAFDPDPKGSAEDGPQTLADFYRRDRRWCQGNLQHLRLIAEPGLDPVSRLHLASGIAGYLVAPVWLLILVLFASGSVAIRGWLPLLAIAAVLILPKLCALAHWLILARTAARRRLVLRASVGELLLSTLIAPLVMLRQSAAVLSVLLGRDCGWKAERSKRFELPPWVPEVTVGAGLLLLAAATGPAASAAWLLPVSLPLLFAPLLQRWLDKSP
jgi:membrane glycosyltransferase